MKKLIKIGKTMVKYYFVANTLLWSYTGIGRYFLDCTCVLDKEPTATIELDDLLNSQLDKATEGWRRFFKLIRGA